MEKIFESFSEFLNEDKDADNKSMARKILSALNKSTAMNIETGYHSNPSVGCAADEFHFRPRNVKIRSHNLEAIDNCLKKLNVEYRIEGNNIYVKGYIQ